MPKAKRICLEPGCPNTAGNRGRCTQHQRAADQARGTRQQRGYDARYDRVRRAYAVRMARGETFWCWRCGTMINPEAWHLGHDDHDRSIIRGPECPPCNLATAGR